jgi:hypothetical protein
MAAASVLQESHQLSGRDVDVKRAVPGTNKLFVGGLPQNTTSNELREHFEEYGVVSDSVVMIDPATSRSRGFGFVCFLPGNEGDDAVTKALYQYRNHHIRGKWNEVKSAAPPHKLAATAKNGQDGQLPLSAMMPPSDCDRPRTDSEGVSSTSMTGDVTPQRAAHALGSPRKVALPGDADMSLQQLPPGLTAPMPPNDFNASSQMPWWSPQSWPQSEGLHKWSAQSQWPQPLAPGFVPLPPYSDPASIHVPNLGADYFRSSPYVDQSGFSAAESLQRNLEQFLRQSTMQNKTVHNRDPSVSTTCSSATQTDLAAAAALLP